MSIIEDCDAKVGGQEIPKITRKFCLGVQNEAGQRLIEFCQGTRWSYKHHFPTTQETTLHMDITRWSILKSIRMADIKNKKKMVIIPNLKIFQRNWISPGLLLGMQNDRPAGKQFGSFFKT